jgi:hypothetical protein
MDRLVGACRHTGLLGELIQVFQLPPSGLPPPLSLPLTPNRAVLKPFNTSTPVTFDPTQPPSGPSASPPPAKVIPSRPSSSPTYCHTPPVCSNPPPPRGPRHTAVAPLYKATKLCSRLSPLEALCGARWPWTSFRKSSQPLT